MWAVIALGILTILDVAKNLREKLSGQGKNVFRLMMAAVLASITLTSVSSLLQITRDMQEMNSDSVVGVDAAVHIRRLLVDIRREVDGSPAPSNSLKVALAKKKLSSLHAWYLTGAFEPEDKENARLMYEAGALYLSNLAGAIESTEKGIAQETDLGLTAALAAADGAVDYNLRQLHISAEIVEGNASMALHLSYRIWVVACIVTTALFLVVFVDSWWSRKASFPEMNRERK